MDKMRVFVDNVWEEIPFNKDDNSFYFIAAHTINGTRFYSDTISNFDDAKEIFYGYVYTIEYFEGGHVEMYQIFDDDYKILAIVRI